MPSLILASASPSRRQLLASAGLVFAIEPAGVDEEEVKRSLATAAPQELAETLAEMKAVRVSTRHPTAMVVGADSTLACKGRMFDKPPTMDAARKQLLTLRGQTHELFSSVVVARGGSRLWHWNERARLTMRSFNESFLDTYLSRAGEPVLGSVGAYQLEGLGIHLFEAIEGDHFTILGLPLMPLLAFFRQIGAAAQ